MAFSNSNNNSQGDGLPAKIAIISDIHANFQALTAVLESIDNLGIEDIVCLGDVVGYGAQPNECIDLLRKRDIPTLAGNHDHAAVGMTDITFFNAVAKEAVHWTRANLTEENLDWLRERPFTYEMDPSLLFVHASPNEPAAWNYVLTYGQARASFEKFDQKICFIGHSHQPAIVQKKGEELFCPEGHEAKIDAESRYLINVGSVGQPRDRNPAACFVYMDFIEDKIVFVRVDYEIEAAQGAILDQGLPEELAERLGYGW